MVTSLNRSPSANPRPCRFRNPHITWPRYASRFSTRARARALFLSPSAVTYLDERTKFALRISESGSSGFRWASAEGTRLTCPAIFRILRETCHRETYAQNVTGMRWPVIFGGSRVDYDRNLFGPAHTSRGQSRGAIMPGSRTRICINACKKVWCLTETQFAIRCL